MTDIIGNLDTILELHELIVGKPCDSAISYDVAADIAAHLNGNGFAGWDVWHTGGGCTAFGRNVSGGRHILITAWEGCSHEIEPGDEVVVGLYTDEDAECLGYISFVYRPRALNQKEIEALIEAFTDAGCAEVQKRLGITDGMTASLFWSDDKVRRVIRDYVCTEINFSNNAN
jgi:hypothetical protein